MAEYIDVPTVTDPAALAKEALLALMAEFPGWVPNEGHLEVALVEIVMRKIAESRDVASRVPSSIFRYWGRSVLNIPPVDASRASTTSTWTVVDDAGYTIKAGTGVGFAISATNQAFFEVLHDVVIDPGQTSTSDGEVVLVARVDGSASNGLDNPVRLADSLAFVTDIVVLRPTSGGIDRETDAAYLNRLSTELKLLTPAPIVPDDFAVLARRIPGVDRAVAIDLYDPVSDTYDNERTVTVALADESGNAVSDEVKALVQTYLESLREVNFIVNVMDPTYQTVDVSATLQKLPGADAATVQAAALDALNNYLSPVTWDWKTTVRRFELVSLLDRVPGVDYVSNINPPSADIALAGPAALVRPGVFSISVIG